MGCEADWIMAVNKQQRVRKVYGSPTPVSRLIILLGQSEKLREFFASIRKIKL